MHTVALVEDDPNSRELLARAICECRDLKLVSIFRAGEEALRDLPAKRPDVVLMDIKLPGMSGIDCVRALRGLRPPFRSYILMMTEHEETDMIFDALKAGANGYLLKKHASAGELQTAIQDVFTGGAPLSPSVARKMVEYFHTTEATGIPGPKSPTKSLPRLSAREEEVLELLTKGMMYKEIAASLEFSIDGVRKHLQSIYRKLRVRSRSEAMLRRLRPGHSGFPPYYTNM
jgi:DNA-binding NarL/FixJ family response regulator